MPEQLRNVFRHCLKTKEALSELEGQFKALEFRIDNDDPHKDAKSRPSSTLTGGMDCYKLLALFSVVLSFITLGSFFCVVVALSHPSRLIGVF